MGVGGVCGGVWGAAASVQGAGVDGSRPAASLPWPEQWLLQGAAAARQINTTRTNARKCFIADTKRCNEGAPDHGALHGDGECRWQPLRTPFGKLFGQGCCAPKKPDFYMYAGF